MARTAYSTATKLIEIYDEDFRGECGELYRISRPQLRYIAGVSKLNDKYIAEIADALQDSSYALIQFDNFFVVASDLDFRHDRKVPYRVVRNFIADEQLLDDDNQLETDDVYQLEIDDDKEEQDKLHCFVLGVGNVGTQALEDMVAAKIEKVGFIAIDTKSTDINNSSDSTEVNTCKQTPGCIENFESKSSQIINVTVGELKSVLKDAIIVCIVAELGNTTVSDTIRNIAKITKDMDIYLTVGILTLPFSHNATYPENTAEKDIRACNSYFNSLIVIPNYSAIDFNFSSTESLTNIKAPSEVVRGITDLFAKISIIGFDYADVKTVLPSDTPVTFGVGVASGIYRASKAAAKALHPLSCGGVDIYQATSVMVTLSGSNQMSIEDYNETNRFFHDLINEDANLKLGIAFVDSMGDSVKVSVYLSK